MVSRLGVCNSQVNDPKLINRHWFTKKNTLNKSIIFKTEKYQRKIREQKRKT